MKSSILILLIAAGATIASAQTASTPVAPAATAKPAVATAKPVATATKSPAAVAKASATTASGIKLPLGVPPVKGLVKVAFALRYQDIKIGTGPAAEPGKLYKVHYTGWRAADGVKFDSSYDHPGQPIKDKDGKPVLGLDNKPKLGDPQPLTFPQGMNRVFPGFDNGFVGMHVGGKRRLFIPAPLAYGGRAMPDRGPEHPGIPANSDLIFDVELVDVADMPTPPNHPGMGAMPPGMHQMPGGMPPHPPTPGAPPAATAAPNGGPVPAPGAAPAVNHPITAVPATPDKTVPPPSPVAPATAPAPAAPAAPAPVPPPAK